MIKEQQPQHPAPGSRLPLEGLLNTRELGGYPVSVKGQRKRVKRGLLYRSGSPENITTAGKKALEKLGIKTTVDFRSPDEKTARFEFPTLEKKIEVPIDAGNLMRTFLRSDEWAFNNSTEKAAAEMKNLYRLLPEEAIPRYRVLFEALSDAANAPLLYCCSAGKDRTGMASVLILHALGAERETILGDYLASNENLRPYWGRYEKTEAYLVPYFTVTENYLGAAMETIARYGGIDSYITKELRADIHHLRDLYVE